MTRSSTAGLHETPRTRFEASAFAPQPAEERGLVRDEVRLLVGTPDGIDHVRFRDLPDHLHPGDVLVVNTSATVNGEVDAVLDGEPVVLHVAPEAAIGGPLALVQDRDWIELDIDARRLHLDVDDAELERRRAAWQPPSQMHHPRGYYRMYVEHVMQADEGADFDPADFVAFLDRQPDLGPKWRPSFVRVIDEAPLTGSGKVDKQPLRAQGWEDDRVWYRAPRHDAYVLLDETDRAGLRDRFTSTGRENRLPAASMAMLAGQPA